MPSTANTANATNSPGRLSMLVHILLDREICQPVSVENLAA